MRYIDQGLRTGNSHDVMSYARTMAEVRAARVAKQSFWARLVAWWKAL